MRTIREDAAGARLVTIPFSHFCEKARWALDRTAISYREERHLPGLHVRRTRALGARTVPLLVTENRTLTDSNHILDWADASSTNGARIWPDDPSLRARAKTWTTLFDDRLGPATRRLAYHHLTASAATFVEAAYPSVSVGERLVLSVTLPVFRPKLRLGSEQLAACLDDVASVFASVGEALTRRDYLVGDTASGADITFASLAAPLLFPKGHPVYGTELRNLSAQAKALVDDLRRHPAGAFVLRLYEVR